MSISIHPYEPSDAPALFEAARESVADVNPWLPWCHAGYALGDAETWIAAQPAAREQGQAYSFRITDDSGRLLGGCGLNQIVELHRCANLGYWVRTSAAGRGVAPQAVRLLAEWAFANTPLQRLEILAAVGNVRSQRVAEKAGAHREGILRSRLLAHGQLHDAVMYSLVKGRP